MISRGAEQQAQIPEANATYENYGVRLSAPSQVGQVTPQSLCSACSASAFRKPTDLDYSRVCNMKGEMLLDAHDSDPGLRVEINFVSEEEEAQLVADVEELLVQCGSSSQADGLHAEVVDASVRSRAKEEISMIRCTGRPEADNIKPAPWSYGAHLDPSKLPDSIRRAAEKIRSLEGYNLGRLRDVSINKRTKGFFFITPHTDPLTDGPHVFVLGLQSAAVLTFSPANEVLRQGEQAERHSFTDQDLDVLVKKRSLVGFTKDARYLWKHGMRGGIEMDIPDEGTCRLDFWGNLANVVKRSPTRISLVFAFADD